MSIKNNILQIKKQIQDVSCNTNLVAVSKYHKIGAILEAIAAGQEIFAENKVQEAYSKWPEIKEQNPNISLHLIGPLQTNKAADAVRLFDMIESIDRVKLADKLIKEMHKQNRIIPCLIQINIGNEPQKSGIDIDQLDLLVQHCQKIGLPINGFMCIPPANLDPNPYFSKMQQISKKYNTKILSMGMSSDYKIAMNYGATHIRIGTAIFGKRDI